VLHVEPTMIEAKVNLAIILDKEGLSQDSLTQYKDALKVNPKEPKIY